MGDASGNNTVLLGADAAALVEKLGVMDEFVCFEFPDEFFVGCPDAGFPVEFLAEDVAGVLQGGWYSFDSEDGVGNGLDEEEEFLSEFFGGGDDGVYPCGGCRVEFFCGGAGVMEGDGGAGGEVFAAGREVCAGDDTVQLIEEISRKTEVGYFCGHGSVWGIGGVRT